MSGGTYVADSTPLHHMPVAHQGDGAPDTTLDEVRASLRNLRYGSVTIIVQNGVIIQIDRTEKRRLHTPGANRRGP